MRINLCKSPEYYNKISKIYDNLYFDEQFEKILVVKRFLRNRKYEICLDAGCGTGISNIPLLEVCKKIFNLDYSKNMLYKSRTKNIRNLILGAIEYLPLKHKIFDFVISLSVIHDLKYFNIGIHEIFRVLKPKGEAVISFREEFVEKYDVEDFLKKIFTILSKEKCRKEILYMLKKNV